MKIVILLGLNALINADYLLLWSVYHLVGTQLWRREKSVMMAMMLILMVVTVSAKRRV